MRQVLRIRIVVESSDASGAGPGERYAIIAADILYGHYVEGISG
jgi:hypothetical protein